MKVSPFDIVLVSIFLAVALIGGYFKILGPEMVAAIVTGCLAFLAMRVKALGGNGKVEEKPKDEDGAVPTEKLEAGHSHRILVGENGSVKIEDVTPPTDAEDHKDKP